MIRNLSLWLCILMYAVSYGQEVKVSGRDYQKPLDKVKIRNLQTGEFIMGQGDKGIDISPLIPADSLLIESHGYLPTLVSIQQLKQKSWKVILEPEFLVLDEAVVSSYTEDIARNTSLHIRPLSLKQIREKPGFNLSDALAEIPGVSQLSTGPGISKPVIRGLYGNRILVLFSGLRFDNQQWQDEHGMGLTDIGVERVELIKGPLSLLYGTDAVGGVINIIEERGPGSAKEVSEVQLSTHSNTGGGNVQLAHKSQFGQSKWYSLRAAYTNHADYTDGAGNRILNSRFNGYYLKGGLGFKRGNWESENHYHLSYNKFGFIFNDISHFMEEDDRWSRKMSGPHHIVLLNILSSSNRIKLAKSHLQFNAGIQSNYRAEDEGGDELSLQMHLLTLQYALKWNKKLSEHFELVIANNSSGEFNTNYGRRKIVPDARIAESAISAYIRHPYNKFVWEYGLGTGLRHINTLPTPTVNTAEKEIEPFDQTRAFYNFMAGASYFPTHSLTLKVNLSSGVRAPNLAELSSNGLHEGIYTYEIGDPNMDNERNVNGEVGIFFKKPQWEFSLSGYYNQFKGYIYLQTTEEEWFGFPVSRFEQQNAAIYGSELSLAWMPQSLQGLKLLASFNELIGKLDDGRYLPYMPAWKLKPEIRYEDSFRKLTGFSYINCDWVFSQNRLNDEERPTPSYSLLNAGVGIDFPGKNVNYSIVLSGKNLLNQVYYDHLSRLKNYGINNMGRNLTLQLKINF